MIGGVVIAEAVTAHQGTITGLVAARVGVGQGKIGETDMKRIILAALVALALTGEADAADAKGAYQLYFGENPNCDAYLREFHKGFRLVPGGMKVTLEFNYYFGWLLGYATGINLLAPNKMDVFQFNKHSEFPIFVASWCKDNPAGKFTEALQYLAAKNIAK